MENKTPNFRAVSDHVFPLNLSSRSIKVTVIEGKLLHKSYTSLQPFVKLVYANQTWKSPKAGIASKTPLWQASHRFTHTGQNTLDVFLLHTAYFFSEKEIGRCTISLQEVSHGISEWWNLISEKGELAGATLLHFDLDHRTEQQSHVGNHSCDLRSANGALVSPSDPKRKRAPMLTPNVKSPKLDETFDLEQVRMVLV